ncbi:MAG: beta-galactosidase, partial [Planctomycetes bacterium]|nr:beta-galactosidase [Planctomycetota bacterium]
MPTNAPAPLGRADLSHRRPANFDRFWFGVCYYPEHWDAATRRDDAARMRDAGITVVRMGEFSWDLFEPKEGDYRFGFYDEVIGHLAEHGISTMLGTPTAAPPRWLSLAHPDIHRVDGKGVRLEHGSRQHACHMSPVFDRHSQAITRAMSSHFRGNRHVVGWQTDNEFHCHFSECHCANCQVAFAHFLERRYDGDIAALNDAWGTAFWAQTYRSFSEVPTPRELPTWINPGHRLDYVRFLSDGVTRFQRAQVEILRGTDPKWFVFHNGLFGNLDYRGDFTRDLDVLGFDSYPMFTLDPEYRAAAHAWNLDAARSWSGNFIVPEQQSGPGGQPGYFHDHPEPGELRQMTWRSIARGADALLYFRWRTCRFGAEEYWCGLLDHDNVPRRRYDEVARIGKELRTVGPLLMGTSVRVDCAVAGADLVVTAAEQSFHLGLPNHDAWTPLYTAGYAVGFVHPADDLAGLKLYIVPHWAAFDPAWVPALERW